MESTGRRKAMPEGGSRADPVEIGPTEDGTRLRIRWTDRHESVYEPRYLRARCPCAGCVDELSGRRTLDPASLPADVHPLAIRHVGRYALLFEWSDFHSTGIYTYEYLRGICPCAACRGDSAPRDDGGEETGG
jgi:DUF971 family protein